jgi:hypothetical protein
MHVAFELNQIFYLKGYPSIFHSDNGKEFTLESNLAMLKAIDVNIVSVIIVSVTGRPQKPGDQGSVENIVGHLAPSAGKVLKGHSREEGRSRR